MLESRVMAKEGATLRSKCHLQYRDYVVAHRTLDCRCNPRWLGHSSTVA